MVVVVFFSEIISFPLLQLKAIKAACELGVFDEMAANDNKITYFNLAQKLNIDNFRFKFFIDILLAYNVLTYQHEILSLSSEFYENLTTNKYLVLNSINYFEIMYKDIDDFAAYIVDGQTPGFIKDFWKYVDNPEKQAAQSTILSTGTILTIEHIAQFFDFSKFKCILDVGGNTGEFIYQICKRYLNVKGYVVDLPHVCKSGENKLMAFSEYSRISFFPGDFQNIVFPVGVDLVTIKFVLCDWDLAKVKRILSNVFLNIQPRTKLLIIERFSDQDNPQKWHGEDLLADLNMMLISPKILLKFRDTLPYIDLLKEIGFSNIAVSSIGFYGISLIEAIK